MMFFGPFGFSFPLEKRAFVKFDHENTGAIVKNGAPLLKHPVFISPIRTHFINIHKLQK